MPEPGFHEEPPDVPVAEIGRYARLNDARERGLVVAAMDLPYWVVRQGREYLLFVEEKERVGAGAAVAAFEHEERAKPAPVPLEPLQIPKFAVFMSVLVMALLYAAQCALPPEVIERGVADNSQIRAGEWWRVVTALTLHGGVDHIVSNISLAVFVFAFVLWRFGTGIGLFATILGGAIGNALNAFLHIGQVHRSIGSSTAVFAGLGLLAGAELAARLSRRGTRGGWSLIVPIGAGLAFLSLFGGGGVTDVGTIPKNTGNVDLGAHLFGLAAGIAIGAAFIASGLKGDAAPWLRRAAGALAVLLPAVCWVLAR